MTELQATNTMKWIGAFAMTACAFGATAARSDEGAFSPPAVPLVACDPYFSVWSAGDTLTAKDTMHWTGQKQRLGAQIKVDGETFRLMGAQPEASKPLPQTGLEVTPTQTVYDFAGAGVSVSLRFTTPSLPEDIDLLSRPITYVTYEVRATDGKEHQVAVYFDASAELTVDKPEQTAEGTVTQEGGLDVVSLGSVAQNVLQKRGDDLRIDWGYLYLASPQDESGVAVLGAPEALRKSFSADGLSGDATAAPAKAYAIAGAVEFNLGAVSAEKVSRWLVIAYDDLFSIQFMKEDLRPYWRRNGLDAAGLLQEAARDYAELRRRCDAFDQELTADLRKAGGDDFAMIGSLAYRQCFAAGKFVADDNGQPIQFCKENHSNGCIGTSDVFYPMSPQFLMFGPSLAKSFIAPFMEYAASDRWTFPFAPHDLGTYPKANGQVYGGGEWSEENQMPVEESGNMLILMAAVAHLEGDTGFADRYWPQLKQWAEYLRQEGFDPDNQLCTDDFAGHLAHNVNLSAKAICGLGSYAKLCEMRGDESQAREYREVAAEYAAKWIEESRDGDHSRLTFDRPGTWSQKYNLVWDKVLGLGLFPDEVLEREMAFYKKTQNKYGLPLDNRNEYTKLDWVLWTACLTDNRADFDALVAPVAKFLNETPNQQPMTDWYRTKSGTKVGFTARPVVGGVFMRMLYDGDVWTKWSKRDVTGAGDYAPMPIPPRVVSVLPAADNAPAKWRYTEEQPSGDWQDPAFDDSAWREGLGGFGTKGTPNARVGVNWSSKQIWIRREFDLPSDDTTDLMLWAHYDEDAEIYVNGVLAAKLPGYSTEYELVRLRPEAAATLMPKGNTFAIRCRNHGGGQYIDVGLAKVEVVEATSQVSLDADSTETVGSAP